MRKNVYPKKSKQNSEKRVLKKKVEIVKKYIKAKQSKQNSEKGVLKQKSQSKRAEKVF
jgi:hypothetical protein